MRFWQRFEALPADVQEPARRSYALLRSNPFRPSLQFKTVANGRFHSVRVGLHYRALSVPVPGRVHSFWIGTHAEYDKLVG